MSYQIKIRNKDFSFICEPNETFLEAARRQHVKIRAACKNGVCHICRASLCSGVISRKAVTQETKQLMLCAAWPQSDCEIEVNEIYGPGEYPLKEIVCQIKSVTHLQANVYQVSLEAPAGKPPQFSGGQYLAMHLPDKEHPSYFSIASAPGGREIELHIYADPNVQNAIDTVEYLQNNPSVKLSLPFGKACLEVCSSDTSPLLLIAAGTGFAQMKAIVESSDNGRPITLLWGARHVDEIYARKMAETWAEEKEGFNFSVISVEAQSDEESPHHDALEQSVRDLAYEWQNTNVFISGSPKLVFRLMDTLEEMGTPTPQILSDVLEYCERPSK